MLSLVFLFDNKIEVNCNGIELSHKQQTTQKKRISQAQHEKLSPVEHFTLLFKI